MADERDRKARPLATLTSLLLDLVLVLLSPLLLLVWLVLSRFGTRAKLRRGLLAKFWGFPRRSDDRKALWIHAVSVGEVLIAEALIRAWLERDRKLEPVLSVSTFTGKEIAEKRLGNDATIFYAPVDFSPAISCAFSRIRPAAIVLVELELWPNWLLAAARRGVPVWVVNGRLSERSCRGYRRLGALSRALFGGVDRYAVQSEEYAARFESVGVDPSRLQVLGNIKHDRRAPPEALDAEALREELGWNQGEIVVVAGCTHPGEEEALRAMLGGWRRVEPRVRLVIAPRHVERLKSGEIESWGFDAPARWSERPDILGERVLVVDTVGDLERFYALADIVVVGGSFVEHGGHNLLEPAGLGRPTIFGPHHWNFTDEARALLDARAALCVPDLDSLDERVRAWLREPAERADYGGRAREVVVGLRGALDRHLRWLDERLSADGRS